jgi:outer membrane protein TolC
VETRFSRSRSGSFPFVSTARENCRRTVRTLQLASAVLIVVSVAGIVRGQSRIRAEFDLANAVDTAIENNPRIKIADSKRRIALLEIKEARTGKQPVVQFGHSTIRSNDPAFAFTSLLEQGRFTPSNFKIESLNAPDGINNMRSAISVQMPLFDQGRTRLRAAQAEIDRRRSDLQSEWIRQNLQFDVIRGFYGVIVNKSKLSVRQEAVRTAEADARKARNMVELGMTNEADGLIADVELANAKHLMLSAENELLTASVELKLLLGIETETQFELVGDLQEKYFPIGEMDELVRKAFANRPDYLSAVNAFESSRLQAKAVKNRRLPQIDVFGKFAYSSPNLIRGSTDYTVGINLSYALFDPGRKAKEEKALEEESVAELEKEALADQIRLSVVRAFQDYMTARSKIQVTIKSISQADEALRIVRDRYHFGLATFTEVIRAETALVRAKHDQLEARFAYYVSYAAVLLATGTLKDVKDFD